MTWEGFSLKWNHKDIDVSVQKKELPMLVAPANARAPPTPVLLRASSPGIARDDSAIEAASDRRSVF